MAENPHIQRKMHRTAFACVGVAVGMVGLAYASVPLYDLFCKVTGFGDVSDVRITSRDGRLVRASGYSPHPERFAALGIDLPALLDDPSGRWTP